MQLAGGVENILQRTPILIVYRTGTDLGQANSLCSPYSTSVRARVSLLGHTIASMSSMTISPRLQAKEIARREQVRCVPWLIWSNML